MSRANALAVSYRLVRSFSSAFITTQSSSPCRSFASLAGSMLRLAAMFGSASAVLSFVLGRGGSTSRMIRSISRIAPRWNCLASIGGDPVSSSYSMTPRA